MRPRNLLILVVIAAVLAGAAVIKNKRQRSADESSAMGTKLLVDVDLNKVAALSIRSADGSVELAAQEDGAWVASGRFGYPARFSKIRDFVLKLAELKIGFTVTADDQDRGLLKLLPPGGEAASNSAGTEVKLSDAAGATLAAFTFGENMNQTRDEGSGAGMSFPAGQYVVLADGSVVVVDASLYDLGQPIRSWLDTAILELAAAEIQSVTVTDTNGAVIRVNRRPNSSDFEVAGLTDDEETEAYKLSNLTGALANLSFADVADPALDDAVTGLDRGATYVARATDGRIVTVRVGVTVSGESERYMRVKVGYEPPPLAEDDGSSDTTDLDNGDTVAAKDEKSPEAVAAEARELNARISKWVFVIDSYKGDTLRMSRGDLVKQKEKPEEDEQDVDAEDEATPVDPGGETPEG